MAQSPKAEIIEKIVNPEDYQKVKAENIALRKEIEKLMKIIEFGDISTIKDIVYQYRNISQNHIKKLTNELRIYACSKDERQELIKLINYLKNVIEDLEKFLLYDFYDEERGGGDE